MKIAFLCPALPGASLDARHTLSGGTLYDLELCETLKARKHDVTFVETPLEDREPEVERRGAWLLKRKFDLIVQDELGFRSYTALNRWLRSHASPARRVSVVHVPTATLQPNSETAHLERAYFETIDGLFAPSEAARTECERLAPEHVLMTVVRPGLGPHWGPAPEPPEPGLTPHLISVGHVSPTKRYLDLVDVLGRLLAIDPGLGWTATIVGRLDVDPAYAQAVQTRVKARGLDSRVQLVGTRSAEALRRLFCLSCANLNTSSFESWGLALAEGLRCGVPFFSWAEGGLWELAPPLGGGWKVPASDHDQFAERLRDYLRLPHAKRQRAQARALVSGRDLPSWDDAAHDAERFMLRVFAQPRRGSAQGPSR